MIPEMSVSYNDGKTVSGWKVTDPDQIKVLIQILSEKDNNNNLLKLLTSDTAYWIARYAYKYPSYFETEDEFTPYDFYQAINNLQKEKE